MNTDDDLDASRSDHPSNKSQLLACSFNQDGGCLAIGTTSGFSVHNLFPQYSLSVERMLRGGIGHVEMLFRCNLMALVGGGPTPHSAPHRVLIWDDHVPKEIGELSFRQTVLRVKLRKDAIAVALRDRVYVYHLADLSLRDKIYTADNPHGLLSLSTQVQDMVLACPSVTTGHVRVELYGLRKTMLIEAHDSTLRALTLTANGSLLATASHKGTVIRVWDVATSQNVYEFRRGVERAQITCLAFSWDDQWLSCASDKGTTHIFYCDKENKNKTGTSTVSSSSATSFLTSAAGSLFFSSSLSSSKSSQPKSVCQIRGVPHPMSCAFVGDASNLISVAGWDADGNGVLLISEFAAHQEARRVAYHVLVKNALRADETEEERRRRRARGWKPSLPETPDDPAAFGNLQIGEMETGENVLQTQTTDDDFCEVIMEHRNLTSSSSLEPVIDDKNDTVSQIQPQTQTDQNASNNNNDNKHDEESVADDSNDEFDDASSSLDHDPTNGIVLESNDNTDSNQQHTKKQSESIINDDDDDDDDDNDYDAGQPSTTPIQ
ncbi:WD repeat-containing protein [Nitzschia inconspicua]|uniref:WD repeat-containing protein n=1 Tax=Nitzschia inconspicua TaxID=303405 RepID=A0A9K3M019_9STRA|nr:WD repeat-containing protein [Nitzschia inconspicua]